MSVENAPIHPNDLAHAILGYVDVLQSLAQQFTSGEWGAVRGYIKNIKNEEGEIAEMLSEAGLRLAKHAHEIAEDIADHMARAAGYMRPSTPDPLRDLDYLAAETIALVAAAFGGMAGATDPTYVAQGIEEALGALKRRAAEATKSRAADVHDAAREASDACEPALWVVR